MIKHKAVVWVLFLFVLASSVYSQEFRVEISSIVNEVESGEKAFFQLLIFNEGDERDVFKISYSPFDVSPYSKFADRIHINPSQVKLDPDKGDVVNVSIEVSSTAATGREHSVKLSVTSLTNPDLSEEVSLETFVLPASKIVLIDAKLPELRTE